MKRDLYKTEERDSNSGCDSRRDAELCRDSDSSISQRDYLCDKVGEADAEIARLENLLGKLSFKTRAATFESPDSLSARQPKDASKKIKRASLAPTTLHRINRTPARTLTLAVAAMLLLSGMLFYFARYEHSHETEDIQARNQAETKLKQATRVSEIESRSATKSKIESDVREAKSDDENRDKRDDANNDIRQAKASNAARRSANPTARKQSEITKVNLESSRVNHVQSKKIQLKNQPLKVSEDVGNHEQAVQDLADALLVTQRVLQNANEQLQARVPQSVEPFMQRLGEKIFDGRSERNAP